MCAYIIARYLASNGDGIDIRPPARTMVMAGGRQWSTIGNLNYLPSARARVTGAVQTFGIDNLNLNRVIPVCDR